MADLFASGRIIDAILGLVAVEALVLILWRRRDTLLRPLLCNLASGAALMLALRAALSGAHWSAIAGCLALSGLAHGTEMALRLGAQSRDGALRRNADHPRTVAAAPVRFDPHA